MPDESTMPVMPPVMDDAVAGDGTVGGSAVPVSDGGVTSDATYTADGVADVGATSAGVPDSSVTDAGAPAQDAAIDDQLMNSPAVVAPLSEEAAPEGQVVTDEDVPAEVARKIGESHNVLIAISSNPSVDELAAAIGLSIYLDRIGKRTTAIYSGTTPNALEFLKPEETFESTADTLQDFVIALNKDKADHLRYKLDGDYVKIYITPYRHRLSEEDLEFSYGDYNVDLVLALDVSNGIDLDEALREHGRIMHDAVIINITTGNPGRFGEIEWSDKKSSSISEMIAHLLYSMNTNVKLEKEEATAFLTGIVAATNRFSNAGTTPSTMKMASKLMESGANQQLISKNITPDMDNEMFSLGGVSTESADGGGDADPTKLDIEHGNEKGVDETKEVSETITEKDSSLLDDLKAAEAGLTAASAETTPDIDAKPLKIDDAGAEDVSAISEELVNNPDALADTSPAASTAGPVADAAASVADATPAVDAVASTPAPAADATPAAPVAETTVPAVEVSAPAADATAPVAETPAGGPTEVTAEAGNASEAGSGITQTEKVITPPSDFSLESATEGADKYSKMLEDALADVNAAAMDVPISSGPMDNPAMANAPAVPSNPEINGVPSINYMPMPGDEVLPPPPAPPIDMSAPAGTPSVPGFGTGTDMSLPNAVGTTGFEQPATTAVPGMTTPEPVAPAAPAAAAPADPSAFKIPGM